MTVISNWPRLRKFCFFLLRTASRCSLRPATSQAYFDACGLHLPDRRQNLVAQGLLCRIVPEPIIPRAPPSGFHLSEDEPYFSTRSTLRYIALSRRVPRMLQKYLILQSQKIGGGGSVNGEAISVPMVSFSLRSHKCEVL